jgi:hypothetical protein
LEENFLNYFQKLSEQTGIPYPNLIDLNLQDCVKT